MGTIKKTPLVGNQLLRIYNHCHDEGKFKSATLCEVEGMKLARIEIEYYNMPKQIFYPNDEEQLDYILNGVTLTRGGN